LVKPPLNTIKLAEVTDVEVNVPTLFVTAPVNVVVPVLPASVKFPTIVDVPATVKSPVVSDKLAPALIVRFPLMVVLMRG